MDQYSLQSNEAVIMKSEQAYHNGNSCELLMLTNLNLVSITSKGIFKKTYTTHRFPISQIKVINGQGQAIPRKSGNLDVYFMNEQQSFRFSNDDAFFSEKKAEKEAEIWAENINKLVAGEQVVSCNTDNNAIPGTEYIAETLKDTMDTFKGVFDLKNKPPQTVAGACTSCGASVSGIKGQAVRCQYCDSSQQL